MADIVRGGCCLYSYCGAHHVRAQMKIGCEKPADDSFTFFIEMNGAEVRTRI